MEDPGHGGDQDGADRDRCVAVRPAVWSSVTCSATWERSHRVWRALGGAPAAETAALTVSIVCVETVSVSRVMMTMMFIMTRVPRAVARCVDTPYLWMPGPVRVRHRERRG